MSGNAEKWWLETITGNNGAHNYGMSSALGCTLDDLPTDGVPAGSSAFDYTKVGGKNNVYFFDGVKWE